MKKSFFIAAACASLIFVAQAADAASMASFSNNGGVQCTYGTDCPVPSSEGGISYFKVNKADYGDKFKCTLTTKGDETRVTIYGDTTHFVITDVREHIAKPSAVIEFEGSYIPTAKEGEFRVKHSGGAPGVINCMPNP